MRAPHRLVPLEPLGEADAAVPRRADAPVQRLAEGEVRDDGRPARGVARGIARAARSAGRGGLDGRGRVCAGELVHGGLRPGRAGSACLPVRSVLRHRLGRCDGGAEVRARRRTARGGRGLRGRAPHPLGEAGRGHPEGGAARAALRRAGRAAHVRDGAGVAGGARPHGGARRGRRQPRAGRVHGARRLRDRGPLPRARGRAGTRCGRDAGGRDGRPLRRGLGDARARRLGIRLRRGGPLLAGDGGLREGRDEGARARERGDVRLRRRLRPGARRLHRQPLLLRGARRLAGARVGPPQLALRQQVARRRPRREDREGLREPCLREAVHAQRGEPDAPDDDGGRFLPDPPLGRGVPGLRRRPRLHVDARTEPRLRRDALPRPQRQREEPCALARRAQHVRARRRAERVHGSGADRLRRRARGGARGPPPNGLRARDACLRRGPARRAQGRDGPALRRPAARRGGAGRGGGTARPPGSARAEGRLLHGRARVGRGDARPRTLHGRYAPHEVRLALRPRRRRPPLPRRHVVHAGRHAHGLGGPLLHRDEDGRGASRGDGLPAADGRGAAGLRRKDAACARRRREGAREADHDLCGDGRPTVPLRGRARDGPPPRAEGRGGVVRGRHAARRQRTRAGRAACGHVRGRLRDIRDLRGVPHGLVPRRVPSVRPSGVWRTDS